MPKALRDDGHIPRSTSDAATLPAGMPVVREGAVSARWVPACIGQPFSFALSALPVPGLELWRLGACP